MDGNVTKYIPQTFWQVNWSQPDSKGRIDYVDGHSLGSLYNTREEALHKLKTDPDVERGAYLVKVTFQREGRARPSGLVVED